MVQARASAHESLATALYEFFLCSVAFQPIPISQVWGLLGFWASEYFVSSACCCFPKSCHGRALDRVTKKENRQAKIAPKMSENCVVSSSGHFSDIFSTFVGSDILSTFPLIFWAVQRFARYNLKGQPNNSSSENPVSSGRGFGHTLRGQRNWTGPPAYWLLQKSLSALPYKSHNISGRPRTTLGFSPPLDARETLTRGIPQSRKFLS